MRAWKWLLTLALVVGALALFSRTGLGVFGLFAEPPLAKVRSWDYQLQNLDRDVDRLAASPSDLLVIDFSMSQPEGRPMRPFTPEEVARLKRKPDGSRRIVLAYFSIGEAEEYRFYWRPEWKSEAPAWLIAENCRWPRNHLVKFWEDGWKDLIIRGPQSYLGRIVSAGFDGVYLDRVDVYYDIKDRHPEARDQMIRFVGELAAEGRRQKPGFLVVAQNAEDLLTDPDYRKLLDGLGKEDLLYGLPGTGKRNRDEDIAWSRTRIDELKREGKTILLAEYLTEAGKIADARKEAAALGYVPVFPPRALDGSDPLAVRSEADRADEYGTPEYQARNCDGVWKRT